MADEHKPEKAMAGMLKRQNVWPGAASGEACPDASTLAAYFERSLTASETAQWEAHFSTCAHCQEQLAAMVRSEPVAAGKPAEDRKPAFAWVWDWRWMAPVGAAVVVLAFVVSFKALYAPIQAPSSGELTATREAANQPPAASAAQKSAESTAGKSETAAAATTPKAPASPDQKKSAFAVDETKLKKEMAAGTAGRAGQELKDKDAPTVGGGFGAVTSRVVAKPAAPDKGIIAAESRVVVTQAEAAKTQNPANELDRGQAAQEAAPRAPAPQKQERVVVEAEARAPAAPAPPSANKPAAVRKERAAGQQAETDSRFALGGIQRAKSNLRAAPGEIVVSTPTPGVLWRFKDSGRIEFTRDGGKTWEPQKNPSQENILAASAPSENVCWAGGSNGVLLRTTDSGENWVLMVSPTKYAIVSLKASDQLIVSVVSADGHTYETRDAGAHWRAL